MKRKSAKQSKRDAVLASIKKNLLEVNQRCSICGCRISYPPLQLMHILPRSLFPEYYTEEWNLVLGCHDCHTLFDDNVEFRQKQTHLFNQIAEHDEIGARRYFRLN